MKQYNGRVMADREAVRYIVDEHGEQACVYAYITAGGRVLHYTKDKGYDCIVERDQQLRALGLWEQEQPDKPERDSSEKRWKTIISTIREAIDMLQEAIAKIQQETKVAENNTEKAFGQELAERVMDEGMELKRILGYKRRDEI